MTNRNFDAPENINDEFSYITGLLKHYQNNTDGRNSEDQYEYDKLIIFQDYLNIIKIILMVGIPTINMKNNKKWVKHD